MEKYIYNEKNGLWYELQGDYYLPCLKLPEDGTVHIGIWGQRHRRYLKTHRKTLYTSLLTSGKLNSYLADINRQAAGKADGRGRRCHGDTKSRRSYGMGRQDEQYS